jgi:hypothetical protein
VIRRGSILEGLLEDKAVGGRSVKARRRFGIGYLEESESQEGRVVRMRLNPSSAIVTLIVGSKALKPRVSVLESSSDRQARWQKRQEGRGRG